MGKKSSKKGSKKGVQKSAFFFIGGIGYHFASSRPLFPGFSARTQKKGSKGGIGGSKNPFLHFFPIS